MNVSKILLPAQGQQAFDQGQVRLPVFDLLLAGLFLATLACVLMPRELAAFIKFPEQLALPVVDLTNAIIGWINSTFSPLFRLGGSVLGNLIRSLDRGLALVPWQVMIAVLGYLAYRAAGLKLALLTVATGLYVVLVGYWTETLRTLTLVLFALPIAVLLGAVAGVLAYSSRRLAAAVDAMLDFMQTVPAFAFLVPMIVLFGFGPVPGVIASVLYAAPAMARNVRLGLEMTPPEVIDAALVSGCTRLQAFFWVKVPCAFRQILLGLNQTIMATLSMVIFAAAIGGFEDVGWEVLRAARRAEFGNGILAGIIITMLAILLDRISGALVERRKSNNSRLGWLRHACLLFAIILVSWTISWLFPTSSLPNFRAVVAGWLDATILHISVVAEPLTEAIKNGATNYLLLPLRAGLSRSITPQTWGFVFSPLLVSIYAASIIAVAFTQRNSNARYAIIALGLLLYTGFLTFPWFAFIGLATAAAWRAGGLPVAVKVAACFMFIGISGFWQSAMFSLYLTSAAVVTCVVFGGALGILASEIAALSRVMRPVNDFLQTIPPFVILIPVIVFFKIGDFASFLAIVSYSIAAMSRYTEAGLRSVPSSQVEAGLLSGCSRSQLLWLVKLPAAREQLLLGLRQTVMYALAMLSVAALVGSRGLGQDVYVALSKADAGLGLTAGLCIALIATASDAILRSAAKHPIKSGS